MFMISSLFNKSQQQSAACSLTQLVRKIVRILIPEVCKEVDGRNYYKGP